ncbi:MAG: FMN adenylyltransferase [Candidatus Moranbacteria bacterium CG_4_10_14_3_um_filter_44_15]|nr:MAG: FMN adenylyltransferase [Candidatus Moranbacteria bacterium CG06_land_8_20_14_3_00_43_56]PIV83572.1 MAG: FMN adenylyltransferase [Candidatus Moranbacteria bacterium CG17_big_fil_post_rev_8_21_14_2_50_44_12]PIW93592.1 MAG: FMN adenylyltransferase [Candidatus Moranbacteria bacterium CG_4_8_14_3_um_filter_43_15]PIX91037.1 MAG: FMN adenylyltransferase [Candidatus Moranbacteria bacterium CG_4_10_14_3_um_filter_44_15]PJA86096.1 MAG: FMN adenylyltransferase [Candidatus Moranbacteria bacterium 
MKTSISGKVIQGRGKGKKLGFPTINIELNEKIGSGVYAGKVNIDNKEYKAGVFINNRGTLLGAHIIGFSGDLYGEEIEIEIGEKIREVMKFDSDQDLRQQIKSDIEKICLRGL